MGCIADSTKPHAEHVHGLGYKPRFVPSTAKARSRGRQQLHGIKQSLLACRLTDCWGCLLSNAGDCTLQSEMAHNYGYGLHSCRNGCFLSRPMGDHICN